MTPSNWFSNFALTPSRPSQDSLGDTNGFLPIDEFYKDSVPSLSIDEIKTLIQSLLEKLSSS